MNETHVFRGRLLLKVIVGILSIICLALLVSGVYGFLIKYEMPLLFLVVAPIIGVNILMAVLVNNVFSTLTIRSDAIHVSRFIGSYDVAWSSIHEIYFWIEDQSNPAPMEPYALLRDHAGKKLLLLKSTYDPSLFGILKGESCRRGIPVHDGKPK